MTDAPAKLIDRGRATARAQGGVADPSEIEPWVTDWRGRLHGARRPCSHRPRPKRSWKSSGSPPSIACRSCLKAATPAWPQARPRPLTGRRAAVDAPDEPDSLGQRGEIGSPSPRRIGARRP